MSKLNRNEILLQNRSGKGMPYVMAILDDIVTRIMPIESQSSTEES
jgi:DNA gyrase subunit A